MIIELYVYVNVIVCLVSLNVLGVMCVFMLRKPEEVPIWKEDTMECKNLVIAGQPDTSYR